METTPSPEPYRLTASALFDMDKTLDVEQALAYLTEDTERLADLLHSARSAMARATERIENGLTRANRAESVARARDELREYDRAELVKSLGTLHDGEATLSLESGEWLVWLRLIITAGVLSGYANDVHNLCVALGDDLGLGADARQVWHDVSASLRSEDGSYPEPVSSEQAIAQALRQYRRELSHHVSDPRLADGWSAVWRVAKSADLCDVWDTMAEQLGVPRVEITKSGYVNVSGTFSVSVYVEGVSDDDIDISLSDVMEAMDRHDLSIDEWDTSDLEMD
jgi:hypothetical protein